LNTAFASSSASTTQNEPKKIPDAKWVRPTEDERDRGILIIVEVAGTPKQITWHRKGDYFSTVAVDGAFPLADRWVCIDRPAILIPRYPTV
jgi:ribosome biogenesis protein ERB1